MAPSSTGSLRRAPQSAVVALFAIVLASAGALAPSLVTAGDDCSAAKQALEQAQAALSKATRDADTRADAYGQCMAKGAGCEAQKAAYDKALAAKTRALAALKAASARQKSVCR